MFLTIRGNDQDAFGPKMSPFGMVLHTHLPALLTTLSAVALVGVGAGTAQEPGSSGPVPEIEPRFERLFWSDSIQLMMAGGYPNNLSLSPDGRWIAFEGMSSADRVNLWLAPTAGGPPVPLTDGPYVDMEPVWAPSGDAVFFRSSRPAGPDQDRAFVMRLPISPESGHPLGPPRQITLDLCSSGRAFQVSPDGQWIAYATRGEDDSSILKVIPSTGGTARTVSTAPGRWFGIHWGPQGEYLYFHNGLGPTREMTVMRAPVVGGDPEPISTWNTPIKLSSDAQRLVRDLPAARDGTSYFEITRIQGDALVRFALPEEFALSAFAGKPNELLAIRQDIVNPLRVLPVAGGPVRRLNDAWGYDWPLGWSPDGKEVFFSTQLNGEDIFMLAPVEGGPMREVPVPSSILPGTVPVPSADGLHILLYTPSENEGQRVFSVFDIVENTVHRVDEGGFSNPRVPGTPLSGSRGSLVQAGAKFLYRVERDGGRTEARVAHGDGTSTLLKRFRDQGESQSLGIHNDRIAFTQNNQEQGSLLLSRVGSNEATSLFTRPGIVGPQDPAWSPDGNRLAVAYTAPGASNVDFLLVEVDEIDQLVGEPRILATEGGPKWWWSLQWLPDNEHFLVLGMGAEGVLDTQVWLISTNPGISPVPITSDLEEEVWDFKLSPDGRFISFLGGIPRGGSIWRLDLGPVPGLSSQGG